MSSDCPAPSLLAATRLACEVSALQEDLQSARSTSKKLEHELAEVREARQKTERQFAASQERTRGLQQAHEAAVHQLQSKVGVAESETSRLQGEVQQGAAQVQALLSCRSNRLEGLQMANQELGQRLEAAQGEAGKLARQLGAQGRMVDAVEAELAATRTAVAAATEQSEAHAVAVAAYQRRLQETLVSEETLLGELARGQAALKAAQEKLRERAAQAAEHAQQLEGAQRELHNKTATITDLQSRLRDTDRAVAALTAEQADVVQHLARSTELLQESRTAGIQQREAMQQLHCQLAAMLVEASQPLPPQLLQPPPGVPPAAVIAAAAALASPGLLPGDLPAASKKGTSHVRNAEAGPHEQHKQQRRETVGAEDSRECKQAGKEGYGSPPNVAKLQPKPTLDPLHWRVVTPSTEQQQQQEPKPSPAAAPSSTQPRLAINPQQDSLHPAEGTLRKPSICSPQSGRPGGVALCPPSAVSLSDTNSVADLEIDDDPLITSCEGAGLADTGLRPAVSGRTVRVAASSTELSSRPPLGLHISQTVEDPAGSPLTEDFSFVSAAPTKLAAAKGDRTLVLPPAPVQMPRRASHGKENYPVNEATGFTPSVVSGMAGGGEMQRAPSSGAVQKNTCAPAGEKQDLSNEGNSDGMKGCRHGNPAAGQQTNGRLIQTGQSTGSAAGAPGSASRRDNSGGSGGVVLPAREAQGSGRAAAVGQTCRTDGAQVEGVGSGAGPEVNTNGSLLSSRSSGGTPKAKGMADMFASFSFVQMPVALASGRDQQAGGKRKAPEGGAPRESGGAPAKK